MRDELLIAILAAGESRRLGQPKQLVNVHGESLIRRQCRVAIDSCVGPVAVICGCQADLCIAKIADLPLTIRINEGWQEGIASSIREATRAAVEKRSVALLILQADQYRVTAQDLQRLHEVWRESTSASSTACRSRYKDYVGPPAVFPAALFGQLMQLRGNEGARSIFSTLDPDSLIDVSMVNAAYDLDLPSQLSVMSQELAPVALSASCQPPPNAL